MAKGGSTGKKQQNKLSPSKGQLKISNFFAKSSSTELPSVSSSIASPPLTASASTASAPAVVVISDDDDAAPEPPPSREKGKRKRVDLDTSADFVPTTPVTQRRQRKARKKTQRAEGKAFHPASGFPVTSPEHMIYTYVTEVLQIENAFKIEPKRLFQEKANSTAGPSHLMPDPLVNEVMNREDKQSSAAECVQSVPSSAVIPIPVNGGPVSVVAMETVTRSECAETSECRLSGEPPGAKVGAEKAAPNDDGSVGDMLHDLLLEEWDLGDAFTQQNTAVPLDLSELSRCVVLSSARDGANLRLRVRAEAEPNGASADVLVRTPWAECEVSAGEVVSLQCRPSLPTDWLANPTLRSDWTVDYKAGMLVLKPDTLLSTTTVVGSLFCARKSVLAAMFPGGEPANDVMLLGTLVHELAQAVLSSAGPASIADTLARGAALLTSRRHVAAMFAAGLDADAVRRDVAAFAPNVVALANGRPTAGTWRGRLLRVLDVEENIWSPRLGLKGKLDLTAMVDEDGSPPFTAPLEIKTGRASGSAEHRGQVMLYQAMLKDLGLDARAGLLLYLREGVVDRIAANPSESLGLVSLRNRLVPFLARPIARLAAPPVRVAPPPDEGRTNEEAVLDAFPPPTLPAPISHHSACARCAQLPLCALFLESGGGPPVPPANPLAALLGPATAHLTPAHVAYFMRWVALLALEASEPQGTPLETLWTRPPGKRPRCLPNVRVTEGVTTDEVCLAVGRPSDEDSAPRDGHAPLKEGDYVALSSDSRPGLYTGTLAAVDSAQVRVSLDRPMRAKHAAQTLHLDALAVADTGATTRQFLRLVAEDSPRGRALRASVVDRRPPTFGKLPSSVMLAGKDVFSTLNEGQRAAVLKALSVDTFLLIKGMPGSGKTHTVSALVSLLVATGRSVLLTSHTHSAVDTLLLKVMGRGIPVLRLGAEARVNSALRHRTEAALLGGCRTPLELGAAFDAMPVVGCTCLGANHALLTRREFDVCIVDESTQALQPLVLRALSCARRFVLVGDPDQLAPVVRHRQARRLGMDQSLFARLDGLGATAALDRQYRMNGPITALANAVTYGGQLQCANQQVAMATLRAVNKAPQDPWLTRALSSELVDSVVFFDTGRVPRPSTNQSAGVGAKTEALANEREAWLVARLVAGFVALGIPGAAIGVMATYRVQVQLLQRTLSAAVAGQGGPEVNTIDQFQGRDKEVVVLSCTRSDPEDQEYADQDSELLGDPRRLTVALTRARHKLVVVGDAATLAHFAPFGRLLRSLDEHQLVRLRHGQDGFAWDS